MNEQEFEKLMRATAERRNVPPTNPPLDAIWRRVEQTAFEAPIPIHPPRRWLAPLAFAATLVMGVGIGFGIASVTQRDAIATPVTASRGDEPAIEPASANRPSPFVGVAGDYVERTTALLTSVGGEASSTGFAPGTVQRARELLSTTRLVLDAGVGDRALRDLLEDLELVLAQIVRVPEHRSTTDAQLISEALDQREVLPRLTLLLTDRTAP